MSASPSSADFWGGIFVGNLLAAASQLWVLSIPPVLSMQWFGDKERVLATTLASTANNAGIMIGFVLGPLFVPDISASQLRVYIIVQAACATLAFALIMAFFRRAPPSPPSAAADLAAAGGSVVPDGGPPPGPSNSPAPAAARRFHLPVQFAALLLVFGFQVGILYASSTVLSQVLTPTYTESESGWLGGVLMLTGTVGALPLGPFVDRTKAFKSSNLVSGILCTASLVFLAIFRTTHSMVMMGVILGVYGVGVACSIAVGFEYGVELSFPMPESFSSQLLMVASNLWGFVALMIVSTMTPVAATITFVVFSVASTVMAAFLSVRYRRLDYERAVIELKKFPTLRAV